MTAPAVLGIIGGSGLYEMEGLTGVAEERPSTPFGPPSDALVTGWLGSTRLVFVPRHGRGHRIAPHEINARANVWALKALGATHVVSISAVGSLQEDVRPGDFVTVDQFIDLTKRRASTFFEGGIVAHVGLGDPICPLTSAALAQAASESGARVHRRGTYVCIEGPQFSTRAESLLYRSWGATVIGMTAAPEAKLAREAELPYALLALATDYDCWHETEPDVDGAAVIAVMQRNVAKARAAIGALVGSLPDAAACPASRALASAVVTAPDAIPTDTRRRFELLLGSKLASEKGTP